MRAVSFSSFGGPEVLQVIDVPLPEPAAGQIRVRVIGAGVNPVDWKIRRGLMGGELPRRVGQEFSGRVDAIGDGVTGVEVGELVWGLAIGGGAAEFTRASAWARVPDGLDPVAAGGLGVAVETAYRVLDAVGVGAGSTVLINGASGAVGASAVQIARARGAHVIGTASERNHDWVRSLGAEPVVYGAGLVDRVRALGVTAVDGAVDAAGGGALPDLVELAGGPEHAVTIADYAGAEATGVRFSGGMGDERATYGLSEVVGLIEAGRFALPLERTFGFDEAGAAQSLSERGGVRGKLVLVP